QYDLTTPSVRSDATMKVGGLVGGLALLSFSASFGSVRLEALTKEKERLSRKLLTAAPHSSDREVPPKLSSSPEPLRPTDDLAVELADEIAALKVSHAKQVKQLQTELRKAVSRPASAETAALQVMHSKQVERLQLELRRAHATPSSGEGEGRSSRDAEWERMAMATLSDVRRGMEEALASLQESLPPPHLAFRVSDDLMLLFTDLPPQLRSRRYTRPDASVDCGDEQLGQLQAAVGRMQDFERALAASLRFAPM
ncbi:MAG: hypothetical protein SGPRY_004711, partial [Prymnesium sp.]